METITTYCGHVVSGSARSAVRGGQRDVTIIVEVDRQIKGRFSVHRRLDETARDFSSRCTRAAAAMRDLYFEFHCYT